MHSTWRRAQAITSGKVMCVQCKKEGTVRARDSKVTGAGVEQAGEDWEIRKQRRQRGQTTDLTLSVVLDSAEEFGDREGHDLTDVTEMQF